VRGTCGSQGGGVGGWGTAKGGRGSVVWIPFAELAQDPSDVAVWFGGRVQDVSGVDLTEPMEGGPETLLDWRA
jgi:hypothetical protein